MAAVYIDAHKNNLVEISDVFTEVPSALTLCELNKLLQWFVEYTKNSKMPDEQVERMKNIIVRMIVERGEYIENRFQRITEQPDFIRSFPTLRTLIENKAPIPLNPKWKAELYNSERISTPTGEPQLDISSGNVEGQAVIESEETIDTEPEDDGGSTDTGSPKDLSCDMEELYTLAGANRPQQPGPETPRHTFPGPLSIGEDIYYDYAVFIPINDCGTCGQQVHQSNESMIGLRLLAGKKAEVWIRLGIPEPFYVRVGFFILVVIK